MNKKQKKLIEEIKTKLTEQLENEDTQAAHEIADSLLVELLEGLGLKDVTEIYEKIDKWYA